MNDANNPHPKSFDINHDAWNHMIYDINIIFITEYVLQKYIIT